MKTKLKICALAGVFALSAAIGAPAMAQHAEPLNTTFNASGNTSLTALANTIPCTSTFTLVTDGSNSPGNTRVTQATFSGSTPLCRALTAANLPWQVVYTSPTTATIQNANFTAIGQTLCQGNIDVAVRNSPAEIVIDNAAIGSCRASGTLTVSPGNFSVVN